MADMAHFRPHQQYDSGQHPSGYSTLPGRQRQQQQQQGRQMQPRGNGQHVDWDSFLTSATGKREPAIYDGVGPRTSATGKRKVTQCNQIKTAMVGLVANYLVYNAELWCHSPYPAMLFIHEV